MTQIKPLVDSDLPAIVDLSLRAWAPAFGSLRDVLGDAIFLRLHPDWLIGQAQAVRSACANPDLQVYVATVDDAPVGFVAISLNAYHDRMGAIDMIAVDPDHQRTGIGAALTRHALGVLAGEGMESPSSRQAAIPVMRRHVAPTKPRASPSCRSHATFNCYRTTTAPDQHTSGSEIPPRPPRGLASNRVIQRRLQREDALATARRLTDVTPDAVVLIHR